MMHLAEFAKTNTAAWIRRVAVRNRLGHAMIFCGGKQKTEAAAYAAAAIECVSTGERPCLTCEHCRKICEEIHPDVYFVRTEEQKEISAEQCREIRKDSFLRPNEGKRKVYVFEDSAYLNERDQNIFLKLVEEGPSYAVFFFCTENASVLLPTLRSRCGILYLPEEEGILHLTKANDFCRAMATGDTIQRCEFLFSLERSKPTRDMLVRLFHQAEHIWMEALLAQYGQSNPTDMSNMAFLLIQRFSERTLILMIELLRKYQMYCDENAGIGILIGGFLTEWEGIL